MKSIKNQLAFRLRDLRRAKGLTQRDMARHFRLSDVGYGAWERGDTEPSIDNIMRLCEFFGCTADSLIGLAPPKAIIDAKEIKARGEKAKGVLDALFASIDRLE
nr:MAG TPA: helix-turn-helix domain protein [Caudoviricetes sp.]